MVCRGVRPLLSHFHGLTATYYLPQRVVGYRPTLRFFLWLSGLDPPTRRLASKNRKVGRYGLSALAHDTLGGRVKELAHLLHARYRARSRRSAEFTTGFTTSRLRYQPGEVGKSAAEFLGPAA